MQARGEPGDAASGQLVGDPGLEGEAPRPVLRSEPSHVAVVLVGHDESLERALVQHVGEPTREAPLLGERGGEPLGHHTPREADGGRKALGRGARVEHVLGRERLERADRPAIVAELTVVIVLDDESARAFRPSHDLDPARRAERDAGRELVGRREQYGIDRLEAADDCAVRVDGNRDGGEAGGTDDVAVRLMSDLLDRDGLGAARRQGAAGEPEELSEAARDHHALGRRDDAAHPAEVLGERRAEGGGAEVGRISELRRGGLEHRPARRGGPLAAWECGGVGDSSAQVEPSRRRRGGGIRCRCDRGGPRAHPRARAHPRLEPSLGRELGVHVGDAVAGDAEVGGERARRREPGTGREAAVADRGPERAFQ